MNNYEQFSSYIKRLCEQLYASIVRRSREQSFKENFRLDFSIKKEKMDHFKH